MAIYDQEGTGRTEITAKVLNQIHRTVNWARHRMILVDNNSCQATKDVLSFYDKMSSISVVTLPSNIGTAKAINKAWARRKAGEHCIKMDNDCFIHYDNWIEEMEAAVELDPSIGIVGLKRKDLAEHPQAEGHYKSTLEMLPHEPGQPWKVVEIVDHVIGTCQLYSGLMLKEFGYLNQPRLYGFDDSLACRRSQLLGYRNAFIPWIEIDHIDPPGVRDQPYTHWKYKVSGEDHVAFSKLVEEYKSGKRPLYEDA